MALLMNINLERKSLAFLKLCKLVLSVFSYLRTLLAFAASSYCSIDRYLLPAGPTAANLLQRDGFAAEGLCWDRQTDRQTYIVPFYRVLCILCGQCQ